MLTGGEESYWVYILSNRKRRALYVGVTNDIARRLWEHRHGAPSLHRFTSRYGLTDLVYLEQHGSVVEAIDREKQIKSWSRARKDALIKSINPELADLSVGWVD